MCICVYMCICCCFTGTICAFFLIREYEVHECMHIDKLSKSSTLDLQLYVVSNPRRNLLFFLVSFLCQWCSIFNFFYFIIFYMDISLVHRHHLQFIIPFQHSDPSLPFTLVGTLRLRAFLKIYSKYFQHETSNQEKDARQTWAQAAPKIDTLYGAQHHWDSDTMTLQECRSEAVVQNWMDCCPQALSFETKCLPL